MTDHPNVFQTSSTTLATWLVFAHELELRFLRYDAETRLFYFWDPNQTAKAIVDGLNQVDPRINIFRFERTRKRMLHEKLTADGRLKAARQKAGAL